MRTYQIHKHTILASRNLIPPLLGNSQSQAAARAHRMGSKSDFVLGGSWHPVVEWAEEPEIDPEELAKVSHSLSIVH